MTTLLVAEHDDNSLSEQTAKAVAAASKLGADIHVLVAGENARSAAQAAANLAGVNKVMLAEAPAYAHQLAEPVASLIVSLAGQYDAIVAPATSRGKNLLPRVAALLDVMQISAVIAVDGPDTYQRPIYA